MWFKVNVLVCSNAEVRGKGLLPADEVMSEMYALLEDDAQVRALGVEKIVEASRTAKDALRTCAAGIDDWSAFGFEQKKVMAESLVTEFHTKFRELMEYHECLVRKLEKKKDARDKVERIHVECMCPVELAKIIAANTQRRKNRFDPEACVCYAQPEWEGVRRQVPQCLNIVGSENEGDGRKLQEFITANTEKYKGVHEKTVVKIVKAMKAVPEARYTHGVKTADWLDDSNELEALLARNGDVKVLSKGIINCQVASYYQLTLENAILPGIPCVITVTFGYAHVFCMDYRVVTHQGKSFDAIRECCFDKAPMFGVGVGQSVIVPFAWVPIVVGCPSTDDDDANENEHVCFTTRYFLTSGDGKDDGFTATVHTEMESTLTKAIARCSKFLDMHRATIKKWLGRWDFEGARAPPLPN